ncbi:MAG: glycosyltransferase family 39 protein [Bacteroidales bacterium]|nr:glycosyltransferase family 39 protein [Bacteroidales bacterium]
MKTSARRLRRHLPAMLLIAVVAMIISVRHLNEPPAYIHAWAQADNYSLAIGFRHNGGDLFHPQTLIYNKQQLDFDMPESLVTACDLPLHHWLVSILMAITGSTQPWVFRGFTLAVAILGLWALYLLVFVLARSRVKALLVAIFTATAPSYAYYSGSFLPTLPALSLAMGGLLFYTLYWKNGTQRTLWTSLLLLTLAMMSRTSFAVLWIAVACFQLLRILRRETKLRTSWLPFAAGIVLFSGWWFWNMHLRNEYGSLFLGSLLPVRSWQEASDTLQNVHDRWRFHYFQRLEHWLYAATFIAAIVTLLFLKKKRKSGHGQLSLWWLLAIWLFGEMLFAAAMSLQYNDHDYYFLDSFFLPIVLSLAGLLQILPNPTRRWGGVTALICTMLLSGLMTAEACRMQRERRLEGVEILETAVRYKHANQMLDDAGLAQKELRFLTLFSYPQNLPFTMMDRKGYAVMWTDTNVVNHALTFDYDYIIVEDEVYRREFEEAKSILSRLQRIAGNGELSICTLSDSTLHPTAEHFFE